MTGTLRIGTRGSPLALAQTVLVRECLAALRPEAGAGWLETVRIRTTGDRILDRTLAEVGGKGLFTKEIDEALLSGAIDLAVHSVKDLPTVLPDGLILAAVLPREDPRDVLIAPGVASLDDLPVGAVLGTASLRRQAQVLHRRPDLGVVPLRGNVARRLAKVAEGEFSATLLALAGLKRLGLADKATAILDTAVMLPAVGQGAVGVVVRADDAATFALLQPLDDAGAAAEVAAERAMLAVLDGSCRTPIGGLARIDAAGTLTLAGLVARPDGSRVITTRHQAAAAEAEALGREVGAYLKAEAGPGFLDGA